MQIKMNRQATRWTEGFPLGNGHFGAMVFGGLFFEQIDLSSLTFFSGADQADQNCPEEGGKAFEQLRQATIVGDYELAKSLTADFMGIRGDFGTNLAVGMLTIERPVPLDHPDPELLEYERQLDLSDGLCSVSASAGKDSKTFEIGHEFFASHADRALVGRLLPGQDSQISAVIKIQGENLNSVNVRPVVTQQTGLEHDLQIAELIVEGQALETLHSSGELGARVAVVLRVLSKDGQIHCESDCLVLDQVSSCLLLLTLETDFSEPDPLPCVLSHQNDLLTFMRAANGQNQTLDPFAVIWETLLQRHREDFSPLMQRVQLRLGPLDLDPWSKPPEKSVADLLDSENDSLALTALMFQYGRYLLASSSREDSPVPAPLQGIWNDQVASRIGWSCDMHLDINTQMNYWPAEITGLSECTQPLFRWIRERLVPSGKITAEKCYNRPGWVAELVSNAWGFTAPYWSPVLSPCPTGGAWLIQALWEHYQYHPDLNELENWIMPILSGSAEFFSAYLFELPGSPWLYSGPSISPENEFLVDGRSCYASISCTYETTIIRDVFRSFASACAILDAGDRLSDSDHQLWKTIQTQLPRLVPFRVLADGSLAEWSHDYPAKDPQHRHTSHLLALFPYGQITPETTPELAQAAAVSIEKKLNPSENWEDTGWARSLMMLYASRLHDGDAAWEHMQAMYRHLTQPNLLVRHPPTRGAPSFDDVYELDGNTGLCMCIADLLLKSHQDTVDLLPSLPAAWFEGEVRGLRARGDLEVGMSWRNGHLQSIQLTSPIAQTRVMCHKGRCQTVELKAGVPLVLPW